MTNKLNALPQPLRRQLLAGAAAGATTLAFDLSGVQPAQAQQEGLLRISVSN